MVRSRINPTTSTEIEEIQPYHHHNTKHISGQKLNRGYVNGGIPPPCRLCKVDAAKPIANMPHTQSLDGTTHKEQWYSVQCTGVTNIDSQSALPRTWISE